MAARSDEHGAVAPPEYHAYVRAFRRRIQERLVYPRRAVHRGLEGRIELEVELDARGRLRQLVVVNRGEPRLLRDAAVRAVRNATPFPLPHGLATRGLKIRLPIVFELK